MKKKILLSVIFTAGLIFANVTGQQAFGQTNQDNPVKQEIASFTCPMHPDVILSDPGKCQVCGMDLEEKKEMIPGIDPPALDSTRMKHERMTMKKDTIPMKTEKTMPDAILMKESPVKVDTTRNKHDRMKK